MSSPSALSSSGDIIGNRSAAGWTLITSRQDFGMVSSFHGAASRVGWRRGSQEWRRGGMRDFGGRSAAGKGPSGHASGASTAGLWIRF